MKTDFVPKLVAALTTWCSIYVFLALSDKFLTVKALASIGYFEALVRSAQYRISLSICPYLSLPVSLSL